MPQRPQPNRNERMQGQNIAGRDKNGNSLVVQKAEYYCGPMPHPDMLEKYNQICPGAADRIITMAENQSTHRMACEKVYLTRSLSQADRGQVFAFILGLIGILGAIILLAIKVTIPGFTVFFTSLLPLVGAFITGKIKTDKEVKNKKKSEE